MFSQWASLKEGGSRDTCLIHLQVLYVYLVDETGPKEGETLTQLFLLYLVCLWHHSQGFSWE